ncbi:hypothetical protein, partial [Alistipes shahii]|uniref:hypothetical protein n=1 Tax=Alistipes shahii TaxID=328814 RepID=UPI0020982155
LIQHKIKRSTFASERSNPAATPKARTFIRPLAGFLYAPAYSKMYFCPTNCGLSDEKLKPEVRVGYAPKSHKP